MYREKFCWDVGLTLRDYRGVSRVANIDVSELRADHTAGGADLIDYMIDAYYKLQNPGMGEGRTIIYTNITGLKFLHKQARKEENVELSNTKIEGKPVTTFMELPIHRADALLNTEERVV